MTLKFFVKYILPVLAIIGLVVAVYFWRQADIQHWKDAGRAELAAEIKAAQEEADAEARKQQTTINQKVKKNVHEVRKEVGADAPASSYLRGVLDRMRAAD